MSRCEICDKCENAMSLYSDALDNGAFATNIEFRSDIGRNVCNYCYSKSFQERGTLEILEEIQNLLEEELIDVVPEGIEEKKQEKNDRKCETNRKGNVPDLYGLKPRQPSTV